jgi:hypothetical protein
VSVQAFCPELTVEVFDEGIVCRFARPGEVKNKAPLVGPQIEIARDEFAAIVHTDGLWVTYVATHAFECLDHVFTAVREPRIGCVAGCDYTV